MSTNTPVVFNFVSHSLRVIMRDGEPWFVAADVCAALGIENNRNATARLDDDEKGVRNVDTPSGEQQMTIINESGLYSLILGSRKPEAKKFKKWVTSEVLPAIRKTGSYHAVSPAPTFGLTPAQYHELQQAISTATAGAWDVQGCDQWAANRLRVLFNLPTLKDMTPEQLPLAKAELERIKTELERWFAFRAEMRDFVQQQIIGAGTPWTPQLVRKWREKMRQTLPPRPDWLAMQRAIAEIPQ